MDAIRVVSYKGYEIRALAWRNIGESVFQSIFDVLDANGVIEKNAPQGSVSGPFRSIESAQDAAISAAMNWLDERARPAKPSRSARRR